MDFERTVVIILSLILGFIFLQTTKIIPTRSRLESTRDGSKIKRKKIRKKSNSIREIPQIKNVLGKKPLVVYFKHGQCPGCIKLTPPFRNFSSSYEDVVEFITLDSEIDHLDFIELGIYFIPTIFIFDKEGDLIANQVGLIKGTARAVIENLETQIGKLLNFT